MGDPDRISGRQTSLGHRLNIEHPKNLPQRLIFSLTKTIFSLLHVLFLDEYILFEALHGVDRPTEEETISINSKPAGTTMCKSLLRECWL